VQRIHSHVLVEEAIVGDTGRRTTHDVVHRGLRLAAALLTSHGDITRLVHVELIIVLHFLEVFLIRILRTLHGLHLRWRVVVAVDVFAVRRSCEGCFPVLIRCW
jgi:hypothetical protein